MGEHRRSRRSLQIISILLPGLLLSASAQRGLQARTKEPPCAQDLTSCPEWGCEQATTPEAIANRLKRRWPSSGKAVSLTLGDFEALQGQADVLVGQGLLLDQGQRRRLTGLRHSGRITNEGDLVQVVGYVVGEPSAATRGESANCRLKGPLNNDLSITIGQTPKDTEFEGILVKMIPETRPRGWTLEKLQRVEKERWQVLVRGQLFYDSEHQVNDDPDDEASGQPRRLALWELHPVTEFYVCLRKECRPGELGEWNRLEFALPDPIDRGDLPRPEEVQEEPIQ